MGGQVGGQVNRWVAILADGRRSDQRGVERQRLSMITYHEQKVIIRLIRSS